MQRLPRGGDPSQRREACRSPDRGGRKSGYPSCTSLEHARPVYSKETVELLQFIKKAQGLGLSLSEIREIIELHRKGCEPCIHVRALLARRIADLDQRLSDMVALRNKLERRLAGSGKQSKQEGARVTVCPHIEGISPEVKPRGHRR